MLNDLLNHLWYLLACVGIGSAAAFFLALARWAWHKGSSARELAVSRRGFRLADIVGDAERVLRLGLRDDGPMT